MTTIAPDGGVVRTYAGTVDVAKVEDDELDEVVNVEEIDVIEDIVDVDGGLDDTIELLLDELVDTTDEELELLEDDEDDREVVETAVLIQEQPLEILEGRAEQAVAHAGRVTEAVAVV